MAAYIKGQFDFWISSEFFAVGLSAFIGVAIRVALENYFANTNDSAYGTFTQLLYSNTYLVPNMIGCFIMSICIANMKAFTDISTPLYKFFTTGLCGCITTYSSWLNVTIFRSWDANDVYGQPVRILLELWLTWGAFTFGFTFQKLCVQAYENLFPPPPPKKEEKEEAPAPVASSPAASPDQGTPEATPPPSEVKSDGGKASSVGTSAVAPLHKQKAGTSKRTSTVRFAGEDPDDDGRMLSDEEANALEAEAERARANAAANAGTRIPTGRSSTFGRVSAFGPVNPLHSGSNIRGSTVTAGGGGRASTINLRNSNFGINGGDVGRVSSWGRGSMAPSKYDKNSLFAVEEDIVFNELAGRISVWREDGILDGDGSESVNRKSLAYRARNSTVRRPFTSDRKASAAGPGVDLTNVSSGSGSGSAPSPDVEAPASPSNSVDGAGPGVKVVEDPPHIKFLLFCIRNEYKIWCTLFCTAAFILWSILAVGKDLSYFNNDLNFNMFRSVCLAPFGAWVRWAPTRLPWIKAYWPEMNPQTFIVNQLAVFVMVCLLVFAPNYSWTEGIDNGFNGSCSTVSTFFAELHTLYFEKGPYVAIRYGMATFAVSIIIIQIVRGANTPP